MAAHVTLEARSRTATGSAASRRLRREGRVPGVLYQGDGDPVAFSAAERDLRRLLRGEGGSAVVEIRVDGSAPRPAIIKEWQIDPVRNGIVHIDLQGVDLTEAIESTASVVLVGTALGVREGGVLDQPLRDVVVRALPDRLPESIELDVSELGPGDAVHVSDLAAPEGVEILTDPEAVIASVTTASQVEDPEEAAEGEEPGLVGEAGDDE
jgi:large subunit ribosomal protein L25